MTDPPDRTHRQHTPVEGQLSFDEVLNIDPLGVSPATKARRTDPWTAHNAADAMALMGKARNQRWRLLHAFFWAGNGLTAEEAAEWAIDVSLQSEYSTRCSELQRLGLIAPNGETRKGRAGVQRDVYLITPRGIEVGRDA